MSEDSKVTANQAQSLEDIYQAGAKKATERSQLGTNNVVSQEEFLTLLVKQLENQDPLDPMKNEDFAVQLAQFSQLEQLVAIKEGMEAQSSPMSSMASFLGHEIVTEGSQAEITGGVGPNLVVDFPAGLQSARVDLIDSSGQPIGSLDLENVEAGRQKLSVSGANVPDGDYTFRVVAVNGQGAFQDIQHKVTNTVDGFIMSPEPLLVVGGKEIAMEEIKEVINVK